MNLLPETIRTFLDAPRFAVLATVSKSNAPQQTVMWYELQDNMILMNTADGRVKATNLHRDDRLSICVPDGYRYVTITGRAALNDDQAQAQADIARLAVRYHGEEKARQMIGQYRRQHRITICMSIDQVVTHGF